MPKFKFPIPGRKHSSSKEKDKEAEKTYRPMMLSPTASMSNGLSKPQRFFGTENDLSIDSPTRDDDSWRLSSSRSSAMSISISESSQATRSTADTGSVQSLQENQWEMESGVFPPESRARGKASSTLLGQRYGDDSGTISSGHLRNETSSSTLKSYYDRQKSPLAISQQTSESSSRDLALRKGLPIVIPRSPLLQVESVDIFDADFLGDQNGPSVRGGLAHPTEKGSKKKPAKLNLSMLFPRSRYSVRNRSPGASSQSSSLLSMGTNEPPALQTPARRKLTKSQSKESMNAPNNMNTYTHSDNPQNRQNSFGRTPSNHSYEQLSARFHMAQIPELEVPLIPEPWAAMEGSHSGLYSLRKPVIPGKNQEGTPTSATSERHPWNEPHLGMRPPLVDTSSAASVSSHNTKTSRRTSASVFSSLDLKEKSVLALSSGSEDDDSDSEATNKRATPLENKSSRVLNGSSHLNQERRNSKQPSSGSVRSTHRSYRKGGAQASQFSPIFETASNSRLPEHLSHREAVSSSRSAEKIQPSRRVSTKLEVIHRAPTEPKDTTKTSNVPKESRHSKGNSRDSRYSTPKERRVSSKPSMSSKRSSQQPTPPLSPDSVEFEKDPESNRFMAVTQQEEALLAALRQKKAKMREEILEEHESSNRSPPRTASQIIGSRISEVPQARGQNVPRKQQVLLYLDTPISEDQPIDTAEPSPDLSDFLTFGSDEDSTPRSSWAFPKPSGAPRPDSTISMNTRADYSPMTPPSAVRLSAVGGSSGFRERRSRSNDRRKPASNVRFVDDPSARAPRQDLLTEEDDRDAIWGM